MDNLKRVELTIDDLEGSLDRISLVSEPAIEVDFFYFNKVNNIKFAIQNEEKRIVTGPAMIPNMDILRIDPITGERFMVYFSKDTVRKAAEIFFKKSDINSSNLEHSFEVDGVTVFESWLVDIANGKSGGKNYTDMVDGTWMISYKIDNDVVWNDFIKTGIVKGFSIEGSFIQNFMKSKFSEEEILYYKIKKIIDDLDL